MSCRSTPSGYILVDRAQSIAQGRPCSVEWMQMWKRWAPVNRWIFFLMHGATRPSRSSSHPSMLARTHSKRDRLWHLRMIRWWVDPFILPFVDKTCHTNYDKESPVQLQKSDMSLIVDEGDLRSTSQLKFDDLKVQKIDKFTIWKLNSFCTVLIRCCSFSPVMDMAAEGNSPRTGLWSLHEKEMGTSFFLIFQLGV